mmetsp:Transcript_2483/g.8855  ORF Transcript_2483/g.8855 Transcript_2483/m.8855 type:complete len:212 (+) Transcript_2483:848-1483(+)
MASLSSSMFLVRLPTMPAFFSSTYSFASDSVSKKNVTLSLSWSSFTSSCVDRRMSYELSISYISSTTRASASCVFFCVCMSSHSSRNAANASSLSGRSCTTLVRCSNFSSTLRHSSRAATTSRAFMLSSVRFVVWPSSKRMSLLSTYSMPHTLPAFMRSSSAFQLFWSCMSLRNWLTSRVSASYAAWSHVLPKFQMSRCSSNAAVYSTAAR